MAQHSPSSSSTEVYPKYERPNGSPESKMSPTVSRQLIMIFGEYEDDNDNTTNTDRFSRTSMKRNKKGASAAADLGLGNGVVDIFREIKIIKKRRYRTIQSLYMVTKPID